MFTTYLLDHRESSMFCDPGTGNDPRSEAEGNIAGRGIKKLTAFSRQWRSKLDK